MSRILKISAAILILSALVGGVIAMAQSTKQPPTELYVRTVPAGAVVLIDGQQVGKSNDLFKVKPGERKVEVKLDGYKPATKEAIVAATRIERVEFELEKLAGSNSAVVKSGSSEAGKKSALTDVLRKAKAEYDSIVTAYGKEDWSAVDKHANELSDLLEDEVMPGFNVQAYRDHLEKMKPGENKKEMELALQKAERIHDEIKSYLRSKNIRYKKSLLEVVQNALRKVVDYGDDLHDSIRDGKISQAPDRYESLQKSWDDLWKLVSVTLLQGDKNTQPVLHFVRLVVGKDRMTFEGKDTTWEELPELLEKVTNRYQTALELAVASDEISLKTKNNSTGKASALVGQFGFKYLSYIGVHPLGSKGSSSQGVKPATTNILSNPGAELGDTTPKGWKQGAAIPGVKYSWDKKVAREGKSSLCIEKTAQRYFPIASWTQTVEWNRNAPAIELSSQVKAEKMSKAVLDVLFLDKNDKWISHEWTVYIGSKEKDQPPTTHDWKRYAGKVNVPAETAKIIARLQVYGPGKVWFDDVRLVEVEEKVRQTAEASDGISVSMKTTPSTDVAVGEVVKCDILVANTGKSTLTNVNVEASFPAYLYPSQATSGHKYGTNKLSWVLPSISPGATEKLVIHFRCESATARACCKVSVRNSKGVVKKAETCFRIKTVEDRKMEELVEDFFRHNFRDVTTRKTIEWGDVKKHPDGNRSIRYKYLATFHQNPEKVVVTQVFTFDKDGKFVDYENVEGPGEGKAKNPASADDVKVQRRAVGKKLADFPEAVDLSTPESAWAAYQRANIRKDAKAVAELSWVKIDQAREERLWKNTDPESLAIYIKALRDSECVEVLSYHGDLAAVISRLPFPSGKGRHPYSIRSFGLIDGKWKNKGEDRSPTLEAARASFEKKKYYLRKHFLKIKDGIKQKAGATPRPIEIQPKVGATDVDSNLKEIRATFDRDMNTDSFSWCGGGPYFPKTSGQPKWLDKRTCVLPVKLEKGKAYRLALNWGRFQAFRYADGRPATPTVLYFCTRGASPETVAKMTPPKVAKLSIANGAKDVPPGSTKLSVTFDQAMGGGMSWCEGPDTPKFEQVKGSAWSDDKKTCSINALLEPGKSYTVYLNSKSFGNFMNELGISLKPVAWKFTTKK